VEGVHEEWCGGEEEEQGERQFIELGASHLRGAGRGGVWSVGGRKHQAMEMDTTQEDAALE
jgi:hypothetical protein